MAFEPYKITREHILQAIQKIEAENIKLKTSTKYDVVINNIKYPPKEVMRYAHQVMNKSFLWYFGGGEQTNKFLSKFGFEIISKLDTNMDVSDSIFQQLIAEYKIIIQNEGLKKEAYKWQTIDEYYDCPKLNNPNVEVELANLNYKNLVFKHFFQVRKDMLLKKSTAYLNTYQLLFDETISLDERIDEFINANKKLYSQIFPDSKNGTHHDERSIATILAFKMPEMYPLYKSTFYTKLVSKLGRPKAKTRKKYLDYCQIVEEFIDEHLCKELDLIRNVQNLLTAEGKPFYKDKSLKVLAQDILYRTLDDSKQIIDFKSVMESFFLSLEDDETVIANFKKGTAESYKGKDVFVWLKDHLGIIGDAEAHYEIREEKGLISIDIHFESEEITKIEKYQPLVNNLPENIKEIQWWGYKSFRFENKIDGVIQIISLTDEDVIDKIKEGLLHYENTIANEIRALKINNSNNKKSMLHPLNQILYGPPGTGKTFNAINKALMIIENLTEKELELKYTNRKDLKNAFDNYILEKQIAFTTFHQSMSYEDFIEGIKPLEPKGGDTYLKYETTPGIFKKICDDARSIEVKNEIIDWHSPRYFKMSLGGKNRPDVHEWCLQNNKIALGYGGDKDLSTFKTSVGWDTFRDSFNEAFPEIVSESKYNTTAVWAFLDMKIGDVVFISKGNFLIDAIGIIKGEYEFDDNISEVAYTHFRRVEWVATNMNKSVSIFLKKNFSQQTIYYLSKDDVKIEELESLTSKTNGKSKKPYVLIIDEINRGNVSKIFGELITLIEESKRAGKSEALKAILPYSKEAFSVPDNVYIIGTMNTADRSVEALDTALRRRFEFIEMMPDASIFQENDVYRFRTINVSLILETINKRIRVLMGADHQIGHSFFILNAGENGGYTETIEEKVFTAFQKNIIPLLKEYFFGDFNKIGLVLGSGFITKNANEKVSDLFASDKTFNGAEYIGDQHSFTINSFLNADGSRDFDGFEKAIETLLNIKQILISNG